MEIAVNSSGDKPRVPTAKILLWIGLASIVMLFAGLTSGLVVRQAEGRWIYFDVPVAFYVSTVLILLSSLTMILATNAIKKNDVKGLRTWLIFTLGLGLAFIFAQFFGFTSLTKEGVYFVDKVNPSGSFFYAITGLHLVHLFGGILALLVTCGKSILGKYSSTNYLGVSLCAIYWHFLDGLWIYLFVFLAFYRS
jgi:cytochrome c oxidase subunit 3